MALIREGQYDKGIEQLEKAYEILPHPNVLYNIGLAHVDAGREAQALPYFEEYRRQAPPDPAVDEMIVAIKRRLAARQPEGAEDAPPASGKPTEPVASDEEIDAVRAAAEYIREIAKAANSPALIERADHLDRVAESLQRRLEGEDEAPAGGEAVPEDEDAEATAEVTDAEVEAAADQSAPPSAPGLPQAPAANVDIYDEQVVSASRFAESPIEAPNATAVVTAQDIRLSGLTDIGQLLRRVAGVDVTMVSPSHREVSIRGLNQRNSNKVLVLLNGRSVRQDFLGTTWWELIPVSVEDIERIEVIRGPASALYGADAFSGIINIITRAPGRGDSFVTAGGGNRDQARGVASMTGRTGGLAYRVGGGYAQEDNAVQLTDGSRVDFAPATGTPDRSLQRMWLTGELQQAFENQTVVNVGGGAVLADDTVHGLARLRQVTIDDSVFAQAYGNVNTPFGLRLSTFWNRLEGNAGTSTLQRDAINLDAENVTQDVIDTELQWGGDFDLIVPQSLVVGTSYRYKSIQDFPWLDDDHTQHHFAGYIQDSLRILDRLRVQVSARVDRHPLLDNLQFSPRGSVVVKVAEGQSVRAVVGKAFRSPSFLESYLQVQNQTPIRGVSAWGVGSTDLDPESITSYELGYTNQATDYFAVELNAYFNLVKDAILFTDVNGFTLSDFEDPNMPLAEYDEETASFPVSTLGFENEDATFRQLGGEAGVRVFPVRGLDVYANYAIHDTSPLDDADVDAVRARARPASQHKINFGTQYRSQIGLDLSLDLHWVSDQIWVEQVIDLDEGVRFVALNQDSYVLLNARVGYRVIEDRLEVGVTGTNLTFSDKRQHPFAQPMDTRVMGTATLRF